MIYNTIPYHTIPYHCQTILTAIFSTTEQPPPTNEPFNICDITLCEFGRCVVVDGNATCQCNTACPSIYAPVCGTDNVTYPNLCLMDSTACETKKHVQVQYNGECGNGMF